MTIPHSDIQGYLELDTILGETASIKIMAEHFDSRIKALKAAMAAMAAKLDNDTGVTDTNYHNITDGL